ncbi:uncharacterized protein EV420DRAFT_1485227 [Desarmillaria tabescens]|uniref:Uncharacterized protein n=1 Tax=Armillaria tabescens TaxID=1929756 RepID=A0AA39JHD3_ARMTA|nr:uncharacterized protein EV420DRAFT_1485227 [Desarmillaria tabescens]KAK0442673.1 hypothetical protein EV420DRAFT_1485227 [Desarmillaria tabescens]
MTYDLGSRLQTSLASRTSTLGWNAFLAMYLSYKWYILAWVFQYYSMRRDCDMSLRGKQAGLGFTSAKQGTKQVDVQVVGDAVHHLQNGASESDTPPLIAISDSSFCFWTRNQPDSPSTTRQNEDRIQCWVLIQLTSWPTPSRGTIDSSLFFFPSYPLKSRDLRKSSSFGWMVAID